MAVSNLRHDLLMESPFISLKITQYSTDENISK